MKPGLKHLLTAATLSSVLFISAAAQAATLLYSDTFETGDTEDFTRQLVNPNGTHPYGTYAYYGADSDFDSTHLLMFHGAKAQYSNFADSAGYSTNFDFRGYGLTFFYDIPQIRRVDISGGVIEILDPYNFGSYLEVATFDANDAVNIQIDINIQEDFWRILLDGSEVYNGGLNIGNPADYDLRTVRFNTSSATYLDNISISAIPVPAAVWLFGSALAGLGWMRRRQTV